MKKFIVSLLLILLCSFGYSQLSPVPTRSDFARNSGVPFAPPETDDSSIFKFDGEYTGAVVYKNPETRKLSTFKFHRYKRDIFGNYTFIINMKEYRFGEKPRKSHIRFKIPKKDIVMLSPLPCPWKK